MAIGEWIALNGNGNTEYNGNVEWVNPIFQIHDLSNISLAPHHSQ